MSHLRQSDHHSSPCHDPCQMRHHNDLSKHCSSTLDKVRFAHRIGGWKHPRTPIASPLSARTFSTPKLRITTLEASLTKLAIISSRRDPQRPSGPTHTPNPDRMAFESLPMMLVLLPTRAWSAVLLIFPLTTTTLASSPETAAVKAA